MRSCIAQLREAGRIDRDQERRYLALLDDLEATYAREMGSAAAAARAARETFDRVEAEAAEAKRQKSLQARTQLDIVKGLRAHVEKGGSVGQFAISLFDHHENVPGRSNIFNRKGAIRALAFAKLEGGLDRFRRDLLGRLRDSDDAMRNVVRELFGQSTGDDAAAALARAFSDTAEYLRMRFNQAGGHIGKLKDWGLPQAHDAMAVARAGYQAWRDFIAPLLDRDRMVDLATNRPFTDEGLEKALREVFDTIESEGLSKVPPGTIVGSKVANRRADHRFLHFRDADAWMVYQGRFGAGDALNAIVGHIDGMARDISAMEVLGPNPGLTTKWLGDVLQKGAPSARPGVSTASIKMARFETDRMWRLYSGQLNRPVIPQVARFFDGLRNWNVATKLGGTLLSAQTDMIYQGTTALWNGLEPTRVMANYAKLLNPADPAHRRLASKMGMTAADLVTHAERMWRDDAMIPVNLHELSRRAADFTMRASGLTAWTNAGKQAIGMEFMEAMADRAGRSFDRLDEPFRLALDRYGIGADGWDKIRATPLSEQDGRRFLRPDEVMARADLGKDADRLATLMMEMIDSETKFAVPEAGLRAQAALSLVPRGTVVGDLIHSMTQFKSFSVTTFYTHLSRMLWGRGGMSRGGYAVSLMAGLTVMGAFILQMKAIAAGKSPRPMKDKRFWLAAAAQGGASGVAGDFLFSSQSRTGGGVAGYIAGPTVAGVIDPAMRLAGAVGDEKSNLGRESLRFLEGNIPGNNIFYAQLGMRRLLWDNLQEMVDPDARGAFRRLERRARNEFGQDYWWAPGDDAPSGGPDWANALAEAPN